jgi:ABC-type nickel/cobalt efflux system permease component RcnA
MSDDPPRPVSGQHSDPRPATGAPAWWAALGRPDLPLDAGADSDVDNPATPLHPAPPAHTPVVAGRVRRTIHWRAWAFNLAVLAMAVLIICIGVGVLSVSAFLTAALLFGVPLSVAAITATVVARRSR